MKGLVALGIIVIAFLSGLSIVLSAEPLEAPVRILLGLGFAGALAWALRGPLGQALADQLRGTTGAPGDAVLAQLEQLMGELQAVRDDLAELNDRMDFSERLLTQQQQQRAGISPGEGEEL